MANLVSPGVQVSITDESVYGSAGAGTVPMLFVATASNKVDPTGTETDGIAKYTKPANAGKPVLVTSQRELTQYFGNVDFRTVSGSVQQGDETNEYGLLAAYSFLGQASAAYVVRGDVDLAALRPSSSEPVGKPANNTYWLNPATSSWGIFEYNGTSWEPQTPLVELVSNSLPTTAVVNDEYLVAVDDGAAHTKVIYYKGVGGNWAEVNTGIFAPHYSVPASPSAGDVWIKTTQPGGGLNLDIRLYTDAAGEFVVQPLVSVYQNNGNARYFQDGAGGFAEGGIAGDLHLAINDTGAFANIDIKMQNGTNQRINGPWTHVLADVQTSEPVGAPVDGTIWFDGDVDELEVFEVALDNGVQKWRRVEDVQYSSQAPLTDSNGNPLSNGDYWIDTDADGYPVMYRHNGTSWVLKDNTDQSTSDGVVFGDLTAASIAAGNFVDPASDALAGSPDPLVFPVGIAAVNMCRSGGTVRQYDAGVSTAWKWRNMAPNAATGAGSFGRKAQRAVVVQALQAATMGTELREEAVSFRLIAAPNYAELMDEMVTLNSDRNETAFVIVDSPLRKNPTQAVSWVQGVNAAENGEDGLVSRNTYAATYYPSVLTTDPVTGASVVAPASHSVLYSYAYSDNISFQWFAPAGLTRGQVQNASNVGYINDENEFVPVSLSQGMRDALYENKLNPIARFVADGIVIFGQKSLHAGSSALDRVNVARLTAYLRERFAVIGRPYLFEPNDKNTRTNAKATFDGFMADILAKRGVYDFAVVCDEVNNTPARIDRNELYIDIGIEPTKAAEFIYIPVRIVNTGELG